MMENHLKPEKRKHPEGSFSAPTNAKKLRLQVVVPKLQVTQEQLKKLKRKNLCTRHENPGNKYEEETENNADVYNKNVSGPSSQIVRESPVRHRLSNLLDGSVLSPDLDQGILPENFDEKRTNTNFDEDNCKTLTNPDSIKACLFYANESAADGNSTYFTENEECITAPCYPEVVNETRLQENETSTTSNSLAVGVVPSSVKTMNYDSNGVDQQLEEKQSAKDDTVVSVSTQETESKSSASSSFNVAASDVSRTKADCQGNEEAVLFRGETKTDTEVSTDSGCSIGDSSIDYASGYNTLEVVNSLLSDLNEERSRRIELDERMVTMENTNQKLLAESQKLKEMVNDLLQSSKVKGETVSRGTQINMDISLRRGRAVDRATSPLRLRDPSPDLQLLSFSVGCQTNHHEVEHPKMMVSALSQTDEEVIPPKILVSVASQTNLVMPAEVWPHVRARAAPQSSYAAQTQQMVRPTFQASAPVQRQNLSHSTQASNVFHMSFTPSGQFYQLPLGIQSQQTSSFQANPQVPSTAQVLGNQFPSSVGTSALHPTTAGYQSCAQRSVSIRTSQSSASVQQTPVSSASHSQVLPLLGRQVVTGLGLVHPSLNTFPTTYNAQQSYPGQCPAQAPVQTSHTFHPRTQSDGLVQSVRGHLYSTQQQNSGMRSYQQTADPQAALQSRVITGFEPTRTIHTQHQLATAGNQTMRNSVQPNRLTLQQNISQQPSSRLCAQPTLSQPQTQVHPEFRTQRNTAPQCQQGNASTNQSACLGISMQQSLLQPSAVQTPLQTQTNSLISQRYLSTRLNASMIRPVQQSVSQAMTVSVPQLPNLRNAVPERQSQATNLGVPVNQARVTPQQSAHLLPVQSSVQARSSNTYNNTIRQLIQTTAEGNAQVSENDLTAKSNLQSESLFDEIRRVYSELQQSLDEITAKKQKEKNIEKANCETLAAKSVPVAVSTIANTTSCCSSIVVTTDCTTSIHSLTNNTSSNGSSIVGSDDSLVANAHNVGDAHSRASSASTSLQITGDMAQGGSAGQEPTSLFSNKDYYKTPAKTPSGALENTVQRLLANQNNMNSRIPPTSISVSDLFDGTDSLEPSQSEVEKSGQTEIQPRREGAGVCLEASELDVTEADSLHNCKEPNRGNHDCKVSSTENAPSLAVKSDNVERLLEAENGRESNIDSVFIAPQNPVKRIGDIDKDKDDVYVALMSPVIPRGDSGHRDSDSVFAVPSSPVKTKDDSEKIKDELYVNLMSPIIPVSATALAKRFRSEVCQHESVDVASTDNEQDTDTSAQKTECVDEVTNDNSNQSDSEETVNRTNNPDPDCIQTSQDERQFDDFTRENEKDAPERVKSVEDNNIGKDRVTVVEPELPIEAHRESAVTDVNKLGETETVLGTGNSKEGGDNGDEGIEINTGIKRCISAVQQAVSTVNSADSLSENGNECRRSEVGEDSVQKRDKVGEDKEVDTQHVNCAETHRAVDMGDSFAENDSDIAPSGVEAEESVGVEGNVVEDMECDSELQQDLHQKPVAETGQDKTVTCVSRVVEVVPNVAGTGEQRQVVDSVSPHLENDSKLLRKGVEEHSVEEGDKVSEGVEKNAEHTQGIGDTPQAVSTAGSVDIHAKNTSQISPCRVETNEYVVSKREEDVEADVGPRQAMDKTKLAVSSVGTSVNNVKNCRDSVSESTGTGEEREETMDEKELAVTKETVPSLERRHNVGEGLKTDSEPIQSFARVRPVMTNSDNAGLSVQNNVEEMETEVKHSRGVGPDETVGNKDNVHPVAEDNAPPGSGLLTPSKENSHVTGSTTLSSGEHSCSDKGSSQQLSSVVVQELTKNWEASSLTDVSVELYEIGDMQNQPSAGREEARQSLVNGGDITGMRISSNKDSDETENAVTSDPSRQHLSDGLSLPKPRVAVRSVGNGLMIMWDLPANDRVSEIEFYELYSWGRREQWFKVAKMKALRLPMGCMLEHVSPGKIFWFRIRAVSRGGVNGPFSETSSYCLKEG